MAFRCLTHSKFSFFQECSPVSSTLPLLTPLWISLAFWEALFRGTRFAHCAGTLSEVETNVVVLGKNPAIDMVTGMGVKPPPG